jgi:hypothetical protein
MELWKNDMKTHPEKAAENLEAPTIGMTRSALHALVACRCG